MKIVNYIIFLFLVKFLQGKDIVSEMWIHKFED